MKLLTGPTRIHHRYLVNGMPRNCANPQCREPLHGEILRVGDQYFCCELCYEATPKRAFQ